jgi:aspartyl-tRNA(Asn)/glutamyl-tRNA(Gln) amidotransferase subunit C
MPLAEKATSCYSYYNDMADLSRDDVLKLARLARITITDEEVENYRAELSAILGYVEQLQNADVSGLAPTSQVTGLKNVMREDEVIDYGVRPDDLLRIAPDTEARHVKVKRMIG